MDLFQLETFMAVAEEKSFSRAAVKLHRTCSNRRGSNRTSPGRALECGIMNVSES